MAAGDWIIPQDHARYTAADHTTWQTLFDHQAALLPGRACDAFLDGLHALDLRGRGVPDFEALSARLRALTGWSVVAVPGLVPDDVFFDMLADRQFPAGVFIRRPDQLDYLQEPDVFHDVFGHVPMLTDPVFADYMAAYGRGGQRAERLGGLKRLARLYWYTVEFGLLATNKGLRIYGAGIASSKTESLYALGSHDPHRLGFSLRRTMATPYEIDHLQKLYFVVPSLDHLLDVTLNTDFAPLYASLDEGADYAIDEIAPGDAVFAPNSETRP